MFHSLNPEVLVDVITATVSLVKDIGPTVNISPVNLSSIDSLLSSLVEQFVPQENNTVSLVESTVSPMFNHSAEYIFHTLRMKKLALSALINDNSSNVFVNQIADFKLVLLNNTESLTRLSFTFAKYFNSNYYSFTV
jgi:hypothetical protein